MSLLRRDPGRPLTPGERRLAAEIFGAALNPDPVRIHRKTWFPFQPSNVAIAPDGHIWFHPDGGLWQADFGQASDRMQAFLVTSWRMSGSISMASVCGCGAIPSAVTITGLRTESRSIAMESNNAMIIEHAFTARRAGQPNAALEALLKDAGLRA